MADLAALLAAREAILKNRLMGVREIEYADGSRVQYRTDEEYQALLAALDRDIARARGAQPIRQVRIASSKGM